MKSWLSIHVHVYGMGYCLPCLVNHTIFPCVNIHESSNWILTEHNKVLGIPVEPFITKRSKWVFSNQLMLVMCSINYRTNLPFGEYITSVESNYAHATQYNCLFFLGLSLSHVLCCRVINYMGRLQKMRKCPPALLTMTAMHIYLSEDWIIYAEWMLKKTRFNHCTDLTYRPHKYLI